MQHAGGASCSAASERGQVSQWNSRNPRNKSSSQLAMITYSQSRFVAINPFQRRPREGLNSKPLDNEPQRDPHADSSRKERGRKDA
eukprot:1853303-Amphidinium_carterae.1